MKKPLKLFIAWLLLSVVALVGGQLIGSFFFTSIAKYNNLPIGVTTLYRLYVVSNGQVLGMWSYIAALFISVLPCFILTVMLLVTIFLPKKRELHGSAKFATESEIRQAKLLDSKYKAPDILIGRYKNKYLRWGGNEFCFLAAPTRSGKGVGIVIPNCLHYRDSLVVFDPKLENFRITAGFRAAHGHEVYLFNPSASDFKSHRWNPLTYVSRDPDFSYRDLSQMASILFAGGNDKDKFFDDMAKNLFIGLGLYLIETEDETGVVPTMRELIRLSQPEDGDLKKWVEAVVEEGGVSKDCISALLTYARASANTASSILASMQAPLSVFVDPVVAEVTSGDDFNLDDLRKKRMTIYVGINMNDVGRFERLNNLFFSQIINRNMNELPEDNPDLKYQCLLLMDEFTSLGYMEVFEKGVAVIAGYNIRVLLIFQNMGQLKSAYTPDGAVTLSSNIACQIMYTPAVLDDAKELSETIGYETYKSTSRSKGSGKNSGSTSVSDQQRAVMLPQELAAMPSTDCVIKLRGWPIIKANKIVYYKDPVFKERLGFNPPPIPYTPRGIEKIKEAQQSVNSTQASLIRMVAKVLKGDSQNQKYLNSIDEQANRLLELDEDLAVIYFKYMNSDLELTDILN